MTFHFDMPQLPKRLHGKHSPSHVRSPQQEKELAKRLGGEVTRGSGSGNDKGDVKKKRLVRLEAKTTKNKSFPVTRKMVEKLEDYALAHDELPVIIIEFNTEGKPDMEVAVVPTYVLQMLEELKGNE